MEMMTQTAVDQLIALMLIEIEGHLPANAGSIRLQVEPSERENSLLESAERELKVTQQNIGPCGKSHVASSSLCALYRILYFLISLKVSLSINNAHRAAVLLISIFLWW